MTTRERAGSLSPGHSSARHLFAIAQGSTVEKHLLSMCPWIYPQQLLEEMVTQRPLLQTCWGSELPIPLKGLGSSFLTLTCQPVTACSVTEHS